MSDFLTEPESSKPDLALRSLEYQLRRQRPRAGRDLVQGIAELPRQHGQGRQLGFAVALSGLLLFALSAIGGVSYAANAITHAAAATRGAASRHATAISVTLNAGGDQYRPGYGFGDPNHNHTGPPGLTKGQGSGQKSPPAQTRMSADGKGYLVSTVIASDEQAALYFSVLDAAGNQLLLTQTGSSIGGGVEGPQAKTIHYVMLVPRAIPLQLRIPANLLEAGETYRIRVIAVDAQGNKSRTDIPFTA